MVFEDLRHIVIWEKAGIKLHLEKTVSLGAFSAICESSQNAAPAHGPLQVAFNGIIGPKLAALVSGGGE